MIDHLAHKLQIMRMVLERMLHLHGVGGAMPENVVLCHMCC